MYYFFVPYPGQNFDATAASGASPQKKPAILAYNGPSAVPPYDGTGWFRGKSYWTLMVKTSEAFTSAARGAPPMEFKLIGPVGSSVSATHRAYTVVLAVTVVVAKNGVPQEPILPPPTVVFSAGSAVYQPEALF